MRSAFLIENQLLVASCATVAGEASFKLPMRLATFDAIADITRATFVETSIGPFLPSH